MPYPNEHSCRLKPPGNFSKVIHKNREFFTFSEIQKDLLSDGKTISEIQVMPVGVKRHHEEYGVLDFSQEFIKKVIENFDRQVNEMTVDYNHGSLAENGPEASKAAGWVQKLIDKGKQGLWAVIKWTEAAADYIRKDEYKYVSPQWVDDWLDPKTGEYVGPSLRCIGLTNRPFLDGMAPVTLRDGEIAVFIKSTKNTEENRMKDKLIGLLKLKDSADESEIMQVIVGAVDAKEKAEAETKALKEKLTTVETETKSLKDQILKIEMEKSAIEADKAVETLLREGKLLPIKKEWAKTLFLKDKATFEEYVKDLPAIVDFKARGFSEGGDANAGDKAAQFVSLIDKIKVESKCSFHEAYKLACSQQPELAKAYRAKENSKAAGRKPDQVQ